MTPTTPTVAFDLGRDVPAELEGANIVSWVAYTYPINLCGFPAASVPCGFSRAGLPVGLHIVGRALGETDILRAAAAFEAACPWADKRPPAKGGTGAPSDSRKRPQAGRIETRSSWR